MKKSRIVITLLLAGLICFAGAFIFNVTWTEPQVDRVLIEKMMVTLVMVLSGVITLCIGIVTTIEATEWRDSRLLHMFAPAFLLICIATGSTPPIPAELLDPIALFVSLMVLISLSLGAMTYYIDGKVGSGNLQNKHHHTTDR